MDCSCGSAIPKRGGPRAYARMRRSGTGRLDDETFGNPFRDAKLWRPRNGRPGMRAAPAGEAGVAALLPVDKISACGRVSRKEQGDRDAQQPDDARRGARASSSRSLRDNFGDLYPPYDRTRGGGRGGPLLLLLRRALHHGLSRRRSTSRSSSARSQAGTPEAAARTIFPEHPRRHVRPRLPDRDALRGGLRARGGRGQAGRDRAAPALRDRPPDGQGHPFTAPRPRASASRSSARVPRASPARTGWPCRAMTSRFTTRGRRPAGSTSTGSRATRPRTASRRPRSTGSCGSAGSRWSLAGGWAGPVARGLAAEYDAVFLGIGLRA
jgi:hypothetical protein